MQLRPIYISLIAVCLFLSPYAVSAYPSTYKNIASDEFEVPKKLRSRVDFWKDVFTKYDKGHFVIHHREYPQIIFNVINLESDRQNMSEEQFARFRKSVEKHEVEVVRQAIEHLSKSEQPATHLQKHIADKMQYLGPGTYKYKRLLEEDLIRTQTGIKEKFAGSVRRAGRYLPVIEKIFVEEFNLPVELTRLPFIESSFDYTAYSSVGAAGIWQFMPKTAKLYMKVNNVVDERRDPIEASRAAAKYLRSAYQRLNSWPLAITSYNHGVAGVANKVAKCGTRDIFELIEYSGDKPFGFASANFYPEFLAAVEIYADYEKYFPGLQLESPIRAREHLMDRPASASYMAQQFGVGIQALQAVNYGLSKSVWTGKYKIPAGYILKVPDKNDLHLAYNARQERISDIPKPQPVTQSSSSTIYGGVTYKVRRGDTLISIAKKYGTTVADLKSYNNLTSNNLPVGKVLTVKQKENAPVQKTLQQAETKKTLPEKKSTSSQSYKVQSGDSLWVISIKFGVPIDEIKKANQGKIVGNKLTGGQIITIPGK